MPIVFNGTMETVTIKAHGNFFTFKPESFKKMNDNLAQFIAEHRLEEGLVVLPSEFEDKENDGALNKEFAASEEGKAMLVTYRQKSIDGLVSKHRRVIYNNQISLARDLGKNNDKSNPALYATERGADGKCAMDSFEIVAKYQDLKKDSEQKNVDRIKEIMEKIGPVD